MIPYGLIWNIITDYMERVNRFLGIIGHVLKRMAETNGQLRPYVIFCLTQSIVPIPYQGHIVLRTVRNRVF